MSRRQENSSSSSQRSSARLTGNSSNSNTANELRNTRKRPVEEVVIDEDNEVPNTDNAIEEVVKVPRKFDVSEFLFQPNVKDNHKFESLTPAVQGQCVKAVSRLFVMKGARKETIPRRMIIDVLNEIDPDYKKHVGVVLSRVQQLLLQSLGYAIVSADCIIGMKNGKSDEYYVTNNLTNPKLLKLLIQAKRYNHYNPVVSSERPQQGGSSSSSSSSSQPLTGRGARRESSARPNYAENDGEENVDEEDGAGTGAGQGSGGTTIAYVGFLVLVCGTIYTAPQKRISCEDLLSHIRKVDPRFPTRLTAAKDGAVCPVPELEEQFLSLIKRLQKEHYLVAKKPEGDKAEENVIYSLGPRFYLDVSEPVLLLFFLKNISFRLAERI